MYLALQLSRGQDILVSQPLVDVELHDSRKESGDGFGTMK
jgi:hypothetical protein